MPNTKEPKVKKEKDKKDREKVKISVLEHVKREIRRHGFEPAEQEKDGAEIRVRIAWKRPRDGEQINVASVRIPRNYSDFESLDELFDFVSARIRTAVDGAAREPITRDRGRK